MDDFLNVDDIVKLLKVKKGKAYEVIRQLNAQLKQQGYKVVKGRVNRRYFEKCFFYDSNQKTG
ncbi:ICEBs1 excisionase [Bacillus vallismortis]|uniref:ICEBs1 excisionase n=1 Tax=Bacillus vallismortis TaxID=72361 RepID=UPI000EF55661|nr:ICEBs1 excisionase [Bacillus vallismortis]MCY8057839.1 ICEBs1 excisionase [Bacillus spizizenii]MCY8221796.1 ICEBs1 excisionase [Bacillus spizizenii]MCY8362954.1 ICEBs1 excisionase [Bacillus spizizenii]MCY8365322.1 ICEBs1 excisionase [Bacillus spizizenii]MCY8891284.1 ICEBs1 excisionase [Bacillus spizizenii]